MGGQIHTQLVYSEIEWLRRRETTSWKGDWSPSNYIAAWMTGRKRGWRRVVDNEYLVKQKDQPETQLRLWWPLRNAWNEIVVAVRAAGVTVKPVERVNLPQPAN
jgi:hypothetical protein